MACLMGEWLVLYVHSITPSVISCNTILAIYRAGSVIYMDLLKVEMTVQVLSKIQL